ncbi:MAG: domain containing protein [Deltaproteobacteria bacterium]|nr:domain containing protein [Deltaproteobacteria bacterium]
MRELTIEWRHYEKEGATCDRCAATGTAVREVVTGLTDELAGQGVTVTFVETALTEDRMAQSNMVLFNGIPLEDLLGNATSAENNCQSCSCLTGTDTACRTVEYEGRSYEDIPEELIRQAAYAALQIEKRECRC